MTEELLTADELAAKLKVSPRTVGNMRAQGCPCIRLTEGRAVRYRYTDVIKWCEQIEKKEAAV